MNAWFKSRPLELCLLVTVSALAILGVKYFDMFSQVSPKPIPEIKKIAITD